MNRNQQTINQLSLLERGTNKIIISVPKFSNLRIILQNQANQPSAAKRKTIKPFSSNTALWQLTNLGPNSLRPAA